MIRSYSEALAFVTFEDRFEYLRLKGFVGQETFGHNRYLNQRLYRDPTWRKTRDQIIIRDNGCDLGIDDCPVHHGIIVHHINPLTMKDIENCSYKIFDPENLICTSHSTHQAITYGDRALLPRRPIERYSGDTRLW